MGAVSLAETLQARIRDPRFQLDTILSEAETEVTRLQVRSREVQDKQLRENASAEAAFRFFRSDERAQNTIHLIQYMCAFLNGLPGWREVSSEPINPFRQFCGFVKELFTELGEEDVRTAVLRELRRRGILSATNRGAFLHRIEQLQRELNAFLDTIHVPEPHDYRKLFLCLQRYCRFWFTVNDQDTARIRNSDILIYQLATLLLERTHQGEKAASV